MVLYFYLLSLSVKQVALASSPVYVFPNIDQIFLTDLPLTASAGAIVLGWFIFQIAICTVKSKMFHTYGYPVWGSTRRINSYTCFVLMIILSVFLCARTDYRVVLTEESIEYDAFWSIKSTSWKYSSIVEIKQASHYRTILGNYVEEDNFIVTFEDGSSWWSKNIGPYKSDETRVVASWISEKSNIKIRYVESLP